MLRSRERSGNGTWKEKSRLLGHVSDVSKTYSCLDVFVSTSLWEGLPYAYLEADCFGPPDDSSPSSLSGPVVSGGILPLFSSEGQLCFCESIASATGGDVCEREKPEKIAKMSQPDKEAFDRFVSAHRQLYLELAERI